jgi:hypothetical protein
MEGVRRALSELGNKAPPLRIQEYVAEKFGIIMETQVISSYKTKLKRGRRGRRARKGVVSAAAHAGAFTLQDIEAVKEVANRIGVDKVKQLADVLSK